MIIEFSKRFRKNLLLLGQKSVRKFKNRLALFQKNPHHPLLYNHKLKGDLNGYWSFSVTGNIRVQYRIEEEEKNVIIKMVRIGSHSELY